MRRVVGMVVLLACSGCTGVGVVQDTGTRRTEEANPAPTASLGDRVWMRSDSTGRPGVMQIFLSDGTLVMDSCWETYQLARWHAESDSVLAWDEAGGTVRARVTELSDDRLALRLELAGGGEEQHFRVMTGPYICPDLHR